MEQEETYVGIDVAKAQVDVAIRPADDRWRVPQRETFAQLWVLGFESLKP